MARRLLHTDTKAKADEDVAPSTVYKRGVVQAARITAGAMEDIGRGSDLQFSGNIADALYHIASALERIADVMQGKQP